MKPAPTVAVHLLQTPEDLETADDMLDGQPGAGQLTILSALFRRQRLLFGRLVGRTRTRVFSPDALVTRVRRQFRLWMDVRLRLAEKSEIVGRPLARGGADDGAADRVNKQLGFQGVALFLPAVPAFLIFFGRSQGTSLTSMRTAVQTVVSSCNALRPGREKRPLARSASSTRTTARCAVASWMPQSSPRWENVRYSRQNSRASSSCSSRRRAGGRPARVLRLCQSCRASSMSAKTSGYTPVRRRNRLRLSVMVCVYRG